jgi:preprotein translocase subunit SecA
MRPSPPPIPGPVLGAYPQRSDAEAPWLRPAWLAPLMRVAMRWQPAAPLAAVRAQQARWAARSGAEVAAALLPLRARLARDGWRGVALQAEVLGAVAAAASRALGRTPYDTQLRCAHIVLSGQLAEMATGEGKTLAVALAACVAALAGVPVHVMTANDYLAARDAALLAPLYAALGLRVGVVQASSPPEARRAAYACDITHCTAREVAFDHLRDRALLHPLGSALQQHAAALCGQAAPPLLLRGLCLALVDEADSLLIDEATTPLVLAELDDDPAQRALAVQALAVARRVVLGVHAQIEPGTQAVSWSADGEAWLAEATAAWPGLWAQRRHRLAQVGQALVALHALQRDRDYLLRDGQVQLLDAVTGRTAPGRVWSRGLQALVELREGVALSPATRTQAQTSYQRFFSRYLQVGGTSGTLAECQAELGAVYGLAVVPVATRLPSQRVIGPHRQFAHATTRHSAAVARVHTLVAQGRPVLLGVASVAEALAMSQALSAAGVAHQRLDASQDAHEAQIVAAAGQAGAVTVATALAGRGTDIALGEGVAARGGLHVLCCQDNRSARLDRQLIGRAARQGEPGSAETWLLSARAHSTSPPNGRQPSEEGGLLAAPAWLRAVQRWQQRAHQQQGMRQRRQLLEQDLSWQQRFDVTRLRA